MDHDVARTQVAAARVAYLGTITASATPHVVPVCFALVGEAVYTAIDHKPKRTHRLKRLANIAANPAACLLVSGYDDDWSRLWWVRLDGAARVIEHDGERAAALDVLVGKYPQYAEQRPSGPVIGLDIQRWSAWSGS